jgi:Rab-GTPase-TBC domain
MEDYDLRSCFLPDLSGLHLRIYQFNELLRQHVPKVAQHLEYLGFEGEYLSQWFLSFYAVTCPLPLLFRIYDVIFAEGASETIMRVALAIMQRNEKKILGYTEFEDVMQLLISRQLWDVYGLGPEFADQFVRDFVGFTPLVTRESLNTLEASYRDFILRRTGGRPSILPNVSNAASRFLGRLWSSGSKQQNLAPATAPGTSRPSSTLLRTPSKQSLSTVSSMEGIAESNASTNTNSTMLTDISASREGSVDSGSFNPKGNEFGGIRRAQTQFSSKERELDNQIEDLLKILSEMQRNQALLNSQLQKMNEDRREDAIAIAAFIDQIKLDIAAASLPKPSHRRTASDAGRAVAVKSAPKISATSIRLLQSLETRLASEHSRRSSGVETKADLRDNIATMREQLHVETTRSRELARELDTKDQELSSYREDLKDARNLVKDSLSEKKRLEKTIQDLRQNQRQPPLSRSNSKSAEDSDGDSTKSGLREFRLGRGITRTNSNTPTQVLPKRNSSLFNPNPTMLAVADTPLANSTRPRHISTASVPLANHQTPETDALLLDLANAKTAEAVARQELEELRAKFDAMRKLMNMPAPSPTASVSEAIAIPNRQSDTPSPANAPTGSTPSGIASATFSGFFGWGSKR